MSLFHHVTVSTPNGDLYFFEEQTVVNMELGDLTYYSVDQAKGQAPCIVIYRYIWA